MTTTLNASTSSGFVMTPDNSGVIALQNNGTTGLSVDASGRVNMPLQPAFKVGAGASAWTGTQGVIALNTAALNVGSYFNTSTYRFVAPVAGNYYFFAQTMVRSTSTEWGDITIKKNGTAICYAEDNNVSRGGMISTAIVVALAVNDYVDLSWSSSTGARQYYAGSLETYMTGYLIG